MPAHSRCRTALVVFLVVLPLTGCLFRSRKVEQKFSTAPLKSAEQQELIDYVNGQAAKIQSIQATVDIDTTVGGIKKGKITDYQQIRGYVLARKPSMLRMIGLMPIVRNTAFDMVSDGQNFKLWIPPKNRFVVGHNDVQTKNAQSPLESIRPQQIYDALLIPEVDPKNEIAVMENDFETVTDAKGHTVQQPDYEIAVIRKNKTGEFVVDWLSLRIPLLGQILSKSIVARTMRTLGTLVASGVPILEGLTIARDTAGNSVFR